ncbi:ASPARTYL AMINOPEPTIDASE [Salix koriyanagi]|uniref:aspartyl aminopeptidase n=1 Tax=Salix koriyanagi TaxID=2511006 RepID=A0A9Q1ADZ9_9ROSI|nr:ASPARTYL AMINOPEPTIDASE [Salix koriyanagi]
MAAASITRLQIISSSSSSPINIIKRSSAFLSKNRPIYNHYHHRSSKFHTTLCCSTSNSSRTLENGSIVGDLLDYLNESWTQFHATAEAKMQLIDAGFDLLNENEEWELKPGGRYFFTRNMSCLVAFAIGEKYSVGNGFHVIAAHTDSPCLKLKPRSASSRSSYLMVNVQTYGSGLWHTWFDRDLSVAGRVIVRGSDGSFLHKLVKIKKTFVKNTNTCHSSGPKLTLFHYLQQKSEEASSETKETNTESSKAVHHPLLIQVLSDELSCSIDDIVSLELNVCDTQPSCLGGGNNEFIFSGRLDNLASSYCALRALIDSCEASSDLSNDTAVRMVALFDNEEVGSGSVQGAGAPTMFQAMKRIAGCLAHNNVNEGAIERAIRQSFLVSADMAHGVHPNFMEKHEEHHRPEMQKGLVIKHNANQRYATSGVTAFLFKEVGKMHNLPSQEFVVRNDMGCGSTIGPILASGAGIRTVDCGIPQLSMHSVREICAKEDVDIAYKYFKAFFQNFSSIDKKLQNWSLRWKVLFQLGQQGLVLLV